MVLDTELDLGMREADVAIRLTPPSKPDLIQRKLRTAHTHLYASPAYLETALPLETTDDLDRHRLIVYGTGTPPPVPSLNWILDAGRDSDDPRPPREPALMINNVYGMLRAHPEGCWRVFPAGLSRHDFEPSGKGFARARWTKFRCVLRLPRRIALIGENRRFSGLSFTQDGRAAGLVNQLLRQKHRPT